jgi:molecular chaperone GrpE
MPTTSLTPISPHGSDVAEERGPGGGAAQGQNQPQGSSADLTQDGPGAAQDAAATLADLQARVQVLEEEWRRALADADNLRKRFARDLERMRAEARAEAARQWLPVVDNLDRAVEHAESDPGALIEGLRAIRDQAVRVLADLGFPRRDDTGEPFDPARHEATASVAGTDASPGTVVQVVRPAYGSADRQLRPAQVVVANANGR